MLISLLVAAAENNVIGKDNQLPWNLPNDLKYFKNITWGMPLVMGRKTFESFKKALKGRTNIVVTRQKGWSAEEVVVAKDLEEALKSAADTDAKEVFVIGGGEIFRQIFGKADKIYITRVHADVTGDVWFPEVTETEWKMIANRSMYKDSRHAYDYSFQVWERKSGVTSAG